MPAAAPRLYSPSWGRLALASLSPDSQDRLPSFPHAALPPAEDTLRGGGRSLRSALDLPVGTHRRRLSPRPVRTLPAPGPGGAACDRVPGSRRAPGRPGGARAPVICGQGARAPSVPGPPVIGSQATLEPAPDHPPEVARDKGIGETRLGPAAFVCCGPREA